MISYRENLAVQDTVKVEHSTRLLLVSVADSFRSSKYFEPRDYQLRGFLNFDHF